MSWELVSMKDFDEYKINLKTIMEAESFLDIDSNNRLRTFAYFIDFANYNNEMELNKKLEKLSISLQEYLKSEEDWGYFYYLMSNLYGDRYYIKKPNKLDLWTNNEVKNSLVYLRKAVKVTESIAIDKFTINLKSMIYTNYANLLSNYGRYIEAIEYWSKALTINQKFMMAMGNMGVGFSKYSDVFYDRNHKILCLQKAYNLVCNSLNFKPDEQQDELLVPARKGLETEKLRIEYYYNYEINTNIEIDEVNFESEKEIRYRNWAKYHHLFINPLNEVTYNNLSARDIFYLPNIIKSIGSLEYEHGLFNVIKQEYISSRFTFYKSMDLFNKYQVHYSDKESYLVETNDYSNHSFSTEMLKSSFQTCFSILDKIAFFLNKYFDLGLKDDQVSFSRIWYKKKGKLNTNIDFTNVALLALFWINKDINSTDEIFKDSLFDEYKEIKDIRNHMQHKYMKIVTEKSELSKNYMNDPIGFRISRVDMETRTLQLLKLTRAAIIYLSYSIKLDQENKKKDIDPKDILPRYLDDLNNNLKF